MQGEPNEQETATIADAKGVIYEGMLAALAEGAPRDSAGVLVDEQFGAEIARKAKAEGLKLAMPVEKSGQNEFDFQFGEAFGEHITEFDPSFSKVLVRFNPEGDAEMNDRQAERLKRLSATGCTRTTGSTCSSCWCRRSRTSSRPSAATRAGSISRSARP